MPPQQPPTTTQLIKRRGLKLAKIFAGIWVFGFIVMELAYHCILGENISLTAIIYSIIYTFATWLFYMFVVAIGSLFIKD